MTGNIQLLPVSRLGVVLPTLVEGNFTVDWKYEGNRSEMLRQEYKKIFLFSVTAASMLLKTLLFAMDFVPC